MRKQAPLTMPAHPTMPADQAGAVRVLVGKVAEAQRLLGQLDYQRALLEAQSVQLRAQLQRDAADADKLIADSAETLGVDAATNIYDLATGRFSPKA